MVGWMLANNPQRIHIFFLWPIDSCHVISMHFKLFRKHYRKFTSITCILHILQVHPIGLQSRRKTFCNLITININKIINERWPISSINVIRLITIFLHLIKILAKHCDCSPGLCSSSSWRGTKASTSLTGLSVCEWIMHGKRYFIRRQQLRKSRRDDSYLSYFSRQALGDRRWPSRFRLCD